VIRACPGGSTGPSHARRSVAREGILVSPGVQFRMSFDTREWRGLWRALFASLAHRARSICSKGEFAGPVNPINVDFALGFLWVRYGAVLNCEDPCSGDFAVGHHDVRRTPHFQSVFKTAGQIRSCPLSKMAPAEAQDVKLPLSTASLGSLGRRSGEGGERVAAFDRFRMLWPERPLPDRQGALVERLGFGPPTAAAQRGRQNHVGSARTTSSP
jgi:hypothetical protein